MARRIVSVLPAAAAAAFLAACATPAPGPSGPDPEARVAAQLEAERRANEERLAMLEQDVARLRADLRHAEETLIAAESGLSGNSTRADAVSSLAEARVQYERAAKSAPWHEASLREAKTKLEEADRQIQRTHFGSAIFFASRAKRIAEGAIEDARQARADGSVLFVRAQRVNMRKGPGKSHGVVDVLVQNTPVYREETLGNWTLVRTPDGKIGWVFRSLLAADRS